MEFEDGLRFHTWFSPPFGLGGFTQWKVRTEIFFQMSIEEWFAQMENPNKGEPK